MNKFTPIYLYGSVIILEGVFLVFSRDLSYEFRHTILGIILIIGALFAFLASFSRRRKEVQFAYHEMQALVMLAYGISILIFGNSLEKVIYFTAFLFIFYSFSEIIFCNWLFNLGRRIVYKVVVIRFLLGLVIGIGTLIAMNFPKFTLEGFGLLFILVGTNILLYIPVMKSEKFSKLEYTSKD